MTISPTRLPTGNANSSTASDFDERTNISAALAAARWYSFTRQSSSMAPAIRIKRRTLRFTPVSASRMVRAPRLCDTKERLAAPAAFSLRKLASNVPLEIASLPSNG